MFRSVAGDQIARWIMVAITAGITAALIALFVALAVGNLARRVLDLLS